MAFLAILTIGMGAANLIALSFIVMACRERARLDALDNAERNARRMIVRPLRAARN